MCMAKIVQVRLIEGEIGAGDGDSHVQMRYEIDARELAYESTGVAALRFEKLAKALGAAEDAGEHRLEQPVLGGRRPKAI